MVRVVPEVAGKKKRGRPERREHADFVSENALAADEKIAERQQYRAGSVQARIDSGEVGKLKGHTPSLQATANG